MIPEEPNLSNPYPWALNLLDHCKNLKLTDEQSKNDLIDFLFFKELYGSFWKKIDKYPISKQEVSKEIRDSKIEKCIDIVKIIF